MNKHPFDVGVHQALIKIAAAAMTEDEAERALRYGAGGAGGALISGVGLDKTLRPSNITWSPGMAKKMMAHMKINDVAIHQVPGISGGSSHTGIGDGKWFVAVAPGNQGAEFLAHELGHVSRKPVSNALFNADVVGTRQVLPLAGGAAGTMMALRGERGSLSTRIAPLVSLAGSAPMLYDEARASIRGYKALKALGLKPTELSVARRKLLHALGTYGSMAALMTVPAAAIAAAKWKKRERR